METKTNTVEQAVAVKRKRNPAVSQGTFISALKAGSEASPKQTALQVAEKLGMGKGSFDQRLNQLRMNWLAYMIIITLKVGGALAEVNKLSSSKKFTQSELDEYVVGLKADGTWEGTKTDDAFLAHEVDGKIVPKPFPFTLADGRGEGNGGGTRIDTTRNAIFAAMMGVDTAGPDTDENDDEPELDEPEDDDNVE